MSTVREVDPRRRIVATADELFYEHGFRAVQMVALRTAAGVSLKRLYSLFPSKESLAAEVLEQRHRIWSEDVRRTVERVDDPRERLLALYDYLAGWFASDSFRGCAFINAFAELGPESPAVARLARLHKERFQAYVGTLVTDAGLPADLAPQLALLAEGAQSMAAITGDANTAAHARAAAVRLIEAADAAPRQTP